MKKSLITILSTIVVIALGLICCLETKVNAEDVITPDTMANNTVQIENVNTSANNNTTANTTIPTNVISSSNANSTNKNTSIYNNTALPKTGAEDYTIVFGIIGICAVAAIYAYKKMNDYRKI